VYVCKKRKGGREKYIELERKREKRRERRKEERKRRESSIQIFKTGLVFQMGREEPVGATPASNLHALHAKSMRETKSDCFTLFSNIGFIYI
jgi:hypothetical protein